jgi:hypothetical protein
MVSMRLCPVDMVQAHLLRVTIVHRGARLGLLDSVEGWRVGDGCYALVHLFTEIAAAYGVQLKARGRACDRSGARARDEGEEHGR